ncbi:MAG TPA: hypothetical protein VFB76_09275 [Candidatus Angelobacter sp.]|nr:hypothetical protein [Candidatus Angelobacter sp.]
MEVNVHEAKTNFSKLRQRIALGEEVIIAKAGVPVAKLVRFTVNQGKMIVQKCPVETLWCGK